MPKEVKAYSCSFGCGRRVQMNRKAVEKHEETCAKNPARRACKICKHKRYGDLPADMPGAVVYEPICAVKALPYGHLLRFDCPQWEPHEILEEERPA